MLAAAAQHINIWCYLDKMPVSQAETRGRIQLDVTGRRSHGRGHLKELILNSFWPLQWHLFSYKHAVLRKKTKGPFASLCHSREWNGAQQPRQINTRLFSAQTTWRLTTVVCLFEASPVQTQPGNGPTRLSRPCALNRPSLIRPSSCRRCST